MKKFPYEEVIVQEEEKSGWIKLTSPDLPGWFYMGLGDDRKGLFEQLDESINAFLRQEGYEGF